MILLGQIRFLFLKNIIFILKYMIFILQNSISFSKIQILFQIKKTVKYDFYFKNMI